jgi:hypothetical protein
VRGEAEGARERGSGVGARVHIKICSSHSTESTAHSVRRAQPTHVRAYMRADKCARTLTPTHGWARKGLLGYKEHGRTRRRPFGRRRRLDDLSGCGRHLVLRSLLALMTRREWSTWCRARQAAGRRSEWEWAAATPHGDRCLCLEHNLQDKRACTGWLHVARSPCYHARRDAVRRKSTTS